MNVDLDIVARVPLDDLVEAMGKRVFVLHIGKRGRKYEAHVELASSHMGMPADRTIMNLVSIVKKLPPRYRRIWDSAKARFQCWHRGWLGAAQLRIALGSADDRCCR
jgi:hypothetical protein